MLAPALRHALVLTWRRLVKIRHSPAQLLSLVVQPAVFVLLFVFMFGGAVAADWRTYLQYVVPGILVQVVVLTTAATGVAVHLDLHNGIFDRFRSLPIARSAPLTAAVLGDVLSHLISATTVLALGVALGFEIRTGPLSVLLAYALVAAFAGALSWVWVLVGVVARTPQQMSALSLVVMLPVTFGSSIFVRPETMPGWLGRWATANPVSALADAVRGLLVGGPVLGPASIALGVAAVIGLVFGPAAVMAYRRW